MHATTNNNIIDNTDDDQSSISEITTFTEYTYNPYQEHEQEILAFRAIVNRHSTIHETIDQQHNQDEFERNQPEFNYRSIYTSYCIFLSWTGDTSPLRYWYNI